MQTLMLCLHDSMFALSNFVFFTAKCLVFAFGDHSFSKSLHLILHGPKQSYFIAETTMPGKYGFDFTGASRSFNVLAEYLFGKVVEKKIGLK